MTGNTVSPDMHRTEVVDAVCEWVAAAQNDPFDPDVYCGLVLSIRNAQGVMRKERYSKLRTWLTRVRFASAVRDAESNIEFKQRLVRGDDD